MPCIFVRVTTFLFKADNFVRFVQDSRSHWERVGVRGSSRNDPARGYFLINDRKEA